MGGVITTVLSQQERRTDFFKVVVLLVETSKLTGRRSHIQRPAVARLYRKSYT